MTVDGAEGPREGRRRTRRREQTRARLLEAAFRVFAARGFGRVPIEEICAAAGYSRGAFYSNFATLDDLFFALYRERAELIARQVAGALAGDGRDVQVIDGRRAAVALAQMGDVDHRPMIGYAT